MLKLLCSRFQAIMSTPSALPFMVDDYVGHVAFIMGGNCRGSALLKADFLEFDTQEDIDLYMRMTMHLHIIPMMMHSAILKKFRWRHLCIDGDE